MKCSWKGLLQVFRCMGRQERKWAQWPLRVISPVFKQQHESQACFWSPAQNVNCNLSHQPEDVVWKWSPESLHTNGGTLWGLCTSNSSNGSSWFCQIFTFSQSHCIIWVFSIAKQKLMTHTYASRKYAQMLMQVQEENYAVIFSTPRGIPFFRPDHGNPWI